MATRLPASGNFPAEKSKRRNSEQALARELQEELAIEAEVGTLKIASTHSYGDTGILILFFEVLFWKGEPKTVHHMELKWIHPSELTTLQIPDANKKILDRLTAVLTN